MADLWFACSQRPEDRRPPDGPDGCATLKAPPHAELSRSDIHTMQHSSAPYPTLLIVDDDPLILETLTYLLCKDYSIKTAPDRSQAIELVRGLTKNPELALVDLGLPPLPHRADEGLALIEELLAHDPAIKIIVLSGQNEEANARHARTVGALDFIAKPAKPEVLRASLARALSLRQGEAYRPSQESALSRIRGNSLPLKEVRNQIQQYAHSRFPVLIEGESGSGKEIAAQALHEPECSQSKPFVALNCAAISSGLIEVTLFGHTRGAFTGAIANTRGHFEEAERGTLFLDEIGELPLELQPKLLRVLETGEYQRVGETTRRLCCARIVAATNRNLRLEVQHGRFRADLYHRLSVLRVVMPPLRQLEEDKRLLLEHYTAEYASQTGSRAFSLSQEAQNIWMDYEFPGNVRELRNIVIRLLSRHAGQTVSASQLELELDQGQETASGPVSQTQNASQPHHEGAREHLQRERNVSLDEILRSVERDYVTAALDLAQGNVSRAARHLGVNRTTLYNRMETLARHGDSLIPPLIPALPISTPDTSK